MIIRTRQHPLARLLDILATVLAWGMFAWLIFDGVRTTRPAERTSTLEIDSLFGATANSLMLYLLLSLIITLILLGWAKYNQKRAGRFERRQRIPNIEDSKLCQSFGVGPSLLPLLQNEQIMTIFNDDYGDIDSAFINSQQRLVTLQPQPDLDLRIVDNLQRQAEY